MAAFGEKCVEVGTTHEYHFFYKIHTPQELHACYDCLELGELACLLMVSLPLQSVSANERIFVRFPAIFCTLDYKFMWCSFFQLFRSFTSNEYEHRWYELSSGTHCTTYGRVLSSFPRSWRANPFFSFRR